MSMLLGRSNFGLWGLLLPALLLASSLLRASADDDESPLPCLKGRIVCKDPARFEPRTVATIKLADVSIADAPATVLAEIEIKDLMAFPIEFELPYDPKLILPGLSYSLMIRIETEGRLDYINDTRIDPFADGKPVENLEAPVIMIRR